MKAKQAEEAYNASIAAAQSCRPIVKTRSNEFTNSRYADLLAIADQTLPVVYQDRFAVSVVSRASRPSVLLSGAACGSRTR